MTAPSLGSDALALLPEPNAVVRCTEFSAGHGVDPGGSAIAASMVLAIETPLPWPKPVFDHDLLRGLSSMIPTAAGPARVLAAVPEIGLTVGRVHAWWRDGDGRLRSAVLRVESNDDAVDLMEELIEVTPDRSRFRINATAPTAALLVCTQGSHDVCCGAEGTRLADTVQQRRPDIAVFRVSHTGGHRFAPTAMTLPDGRMWAHLSADDVDAIVDRARPSSDLVHQCRGWWGAATGGAQMAERAVWGDVGWDLDRTNRRVDQIADDGAVSTWRVATDDSTWTVDVAIAREIPTIACRAPGGLPAKPGREYGVTRFERTADTTS